VDEVSIAEFEQDRDKNLYRIWNRMSSGSYFPPPVKAVEIPKAGGAGVRVLGVPTVADRVAQTVARMYLEPKVEPIFHPDSYGYRPKKSALDAVGTCRQRCWRADCNAVKLGADREDVDLRRVGVKLDFVGCPFDAVAVRPVSFDDPGTCPVPPWAEAFLGDLVDGFGECVAESVRGKSPPGWEPGGGSRGSFA
jgi:hypothetical protein